MARKKLHEWAVIIISELLGVDHAKAIVSLFQETVSAAIGLLISFKLADVATSIVVGGDYDTFSDYSDPSLCWNHGLTDRIFCFWIQLDSILLVISSILTLLWVFFVRNREVENSIRSLASFMSKVAYTVVISSILLSLSLVAIAITVILSSVVALVFRLWGTSSPDPEILTLTLQAVLTGITVSVALYVGDSVLKHIFYVLDQIQSKNFTDSQPLSKSSSSSGSSGSSSSGSSNAMTKMPENPVQQTVDETTSRNLHSSSGSHQAEEEDIQTEGVEDPWLLEDQDSTFPLEKDIENPPITLDEVDVIVDSLGHDNQSQNYPGSYI